MKDAQTINQALGYEMNTIEFAVKDGVPYAIDFLNPAPDFERDRITEFYFDHVVERWPPGDRPCAARERVESVAALGGDARGSGGRMVNVGGPAKAQAGAAEARLRAPRPDAAPLRSEGLGRVTSPGTSRG